MQRIILNKQQFTEAVTTGYEAGLSFSQIAAQTGRSRSAVAGKANRLGLCSRGAGAQPHMRTSASLAVTSRVAALHASGMSPAQIAGELGVSVKVVYHRLRAAKVGLHRRSKANPGPKPSRRSKRPTPTDPTPPGASGALVYRSGPVDLTPPETASWFADGKGCRFSCWPTTEKDPFAKRCCGAVAVRGQYCDYHASVVYAPATKRAA